jgi:hypothetical protein
MLNEIVLYPLELRQEMQHKNSFSRIICLAAA